ncbi:MAG TPA: hypothetical protein VGX92_01135 [Pyrinomonadaceae bacterium]|jgi:hypothetical protein|nr:hypothetical protein [Pyrinomonadaceae bacterium]
MVTKSSKKAKSGKAASGRKAPGKRAASGRKAASASASSKSSRKSSRKQGKLAKSTGPASVSQKQLDLPASYSADGTLATLREVVNPQVPTLSLAELSPAQRVDVVAQRIEAQPKFQIAMVGAGVIDKERAIAEVKSGTKIGRALMEIEQRVINNLISRATKEEADKATKEEADKDKPK